MDNESTLADGTPLPELHQGELDPATLEQLIVDIETCTELLEIIPKYGAEVYVPEQSTLTFREAVSLLQGGQLRGLQARYKYQGSQWWDTLMRTPTGIRLVRIEHNF